MKKQYCLECLRCGSSDALSGCVVLSGGTVLSGPMWSLDICLVVVFLGVLGVLAGEDVGPVSVVGVGPDHHTKKYNQYFEHVDEHIIIMILTERNCRTCIGLSHFATQPNSTGVPHLVYGSKE